MANTVAVANYAPVTWTDKVNVNESPTGTLTKNAGTDGQWDAGAFSNESFSGNGGIKYTYQTSGNYNFFYFSIGVSLSNPNVNMNSIRHAIVHFGNGDVRIIESGTFRTFISLSNNDVIEIRRSGTTVNYWRNNTLVYTSPVATSGALFADLSLGYNGYGVTNIQLKNG